MDIVITVAGKRNAFEVAIISTRILLRYKQLLMKQTKIIYMHVHTKEPESMDIVSTGKILSLDSTNHRRYKLVLTVSSRLKQVHDDVFRPFLIVHSTVTDIYVTRGMFEYIGNTYSGQTVNISGFIRARIKAIRAMDGHA